MSTAIFDITRSRTARLFAAALLILALALAARPLMAQPAASPVATKPVAAAPAASASGAPIAVGSPVADGVYTPQKPIPGIGMPTAGSLDLQRQFSPTGRFAYKFHYALLWVMGAICVFVLGLILYVMIRFVRRPIRSRRPPRTTPCRSSLDARSGAGPRGDRDPLDHSSGASSTSSAPKDAMTVKVTGYQWYWGYTFPDNGGFEVISNMMPEADDGQAGRARGHRKGLSGAPRGADNRLVLPVGVNRSASRPPVPT